jgi:DNA-binding transcriptional ArsR family regulator
MQAIQSKGKTKRLQHLLCSGILPAEDLENYATELEAMVYKVADKKTIDAKARFLKALANDTRLKILIILSKKKMCVCELTVALNLTQPTASHHLNILQNMGLVEDQKEGKWVFYSLAKPEEAQHLFSFLGLDQN